MQLTLLPSSTFPVPLTWLSFLFSSLHISRSTYYIDGQRIFSWRPDNKYFRSVGLKISLATTGGPQLNESSIYNFFCLQWCESNEPSVQTVLGILNFDLSQTSSNAAWYFLAMLGSGSEPQLPVSHVLVPVNHRELTAIWYPYSHCFPPSVCITWTVRYFIRKWALREMTLSNCRLMQELLACLRWARLSEAGLAGLVYCMQFWLRIFSTYNGFIECNSILSQGRPLLKSAIVVAKQP